MSLSVEEVADICIYGLRLKPFFQLDALYCTRTLWPSMTTMLKLHKKFSPAKLVDFTFFKVRLTP